MLILYYHVDFFSYTDHFYSGGDVWDLTGKPRHVQVRLKDVNNLLLKKTQQQKKKKDLNTERAYKRSAALEVQPKTPPLPRRLR